MADAIAKDVGEGASKIDIKSQGGSLLFSFEDGERTIPNNDF